MTLTILLDLDDTLLSNDMEGVFVPIYLKALSNYLRPLPPEKTIRQLLAATKVMLSKDLPELTLEKAFDGAFYNSLGVTKENLRGTIDRFYSTIFPELKSNTHPMPLAVDLVNFLLARGHQIIIATNPVFPQTAVLQRLDWAGLPPTRFPFNIITSYELFHFTKSTPAYYAEILGQLGWPDFPAVMIGDSLQYDVVPASTLGLPVFWLNGESSRIPDFAHPMSRAGSFSEIIPWINLLESAKLDFNPDSPVALLSILKSTPAAMETLSSKLAESAWDIQPFEGEWCLKEIICHMRDLEIEVNLPRFQKIQSEENPFLPGVITDPWADERNYRQQNGRDALRSFIKARCDFIDLIENLQPLDWQKQVRHAIFGPTSLSELVSFITIHDRNHLQQAYKVIRSIL
jgi:FMN phosphatase YigB (HAD superfamily)